MGSLELEKISNELWQDHAHVWNMILSYVNSMSLKCAVELGIADTIHSHGKPIPLPLLLSKLSIAPPRAGSFRRLMRLLVHAGIFALTAAENEEAYSLTTISAALLVKKEASNLSPFVLFMLDPLILSPWQSLSSWLTSTDEIASPFERMHGKPIFELTGEVAGFNDLLNEGMACDAHFVAQVVIGERGEDIFGGLSSLVDVGGGNGTMALAVGEAFPQVKCTVFDLPHVVAALEGNTKVEGVGGDMFEFIPRADAVLLKWILHDWSDEDCIRILKKCREAVPPKERGGKVIIIEMVMELEKSSRELAETQLAFDIYMMVPLAGIERSEAGWKNIFTAAGFLDYKIMPLLGLRSVIELYY